MSFRLSSRAICLGVAVLAASGFLACSARAGGKERGRPIEFSVPGSDEVTTNLHQLTSKKDSLEQLEEDLYKPLELFAPNKSSLDGVVARPPHPTPAPAIQNKRVKELLERRKNWVFMTPEDLLGAPTVDEILKTPQLGPDGQEKKEPRAFERYYQRLPTKRSGPNRLIEPKREELFGQPAKAKPRDEAAAHEDANLPPGVRESAQELKNLFGLGDSDSPLGQSATHRSLSDTFGTGDNTLSKEQLREHKKFMDEYRSIVDPSWHPPEVPTPGNLLAIPADTASPAAKPAAGLPSGQNSAPRTALDAQMDVINPMLGPPGLPDVNAQALGQTRPLSAVPKVESTRVAPPAPTFTAPKRSFR